MGFATLAQEKMLEWQVNPDTSEEEITVPDVCGAFWWAQLHSWAENIRDYGCSTCGDWAVKAAHALHDAVNHHLGKPIQHPVDLEEVTQAFQSATASLQKNDRPEFQASGLFDAVLSGIGATLGAAAGTALVSALRTPTASQSEGHLSPEAVKLDTGGSGAYIRERVADPVDFDPASFRTLEQGTHRVIVGCPAGEYDRKASQCTGSTKAQAILHPRSEQGDLEREAEARGIPVIASMEDNLEDVTSWVTQAEELISQLGGLEDEAPGEGEAVAASTGE